MKNLQNRETRRGDRVHGPSLTGEVDRQHAKLDVPDLPEGQRRDVDLHQVRGHLLVEDALVLLEGDPWNESVQDLTPKRAEAETGADGIDLEIAITEIVWNEDAAMNVTGTRIDDAVSAPRTVEVVIVPRNVTEREGTAIAVGSANPTAEIATEVARTRTGIGPNHAPFLNQDPLPSEEIRK